MNEDLGASASADRATREPSPDGLGHSASVPSVDPNIYVGKSWPRPATPCDLVPKWEGEFKSHSDWVNFASKRLTVAHSLVTGAQVPAICVDSFGRRCTCGGDMKRAEREGAFPVRYFFECIPAQAIEAGTDETAQQAQPEGQERGPKDAPQ